MENLSKEYEPKKLFTEVKRYRRFFKEEDETHQNFYNNFKDSSNYAMYVIKPKLEKIRKHFKFKSE